MKDIYMMISSMVLPVESELVWWVKLEGSLNESMDMEL